MSIADRVAGPLADAPEPVAPTAPTAAVSRPAAADRELRLDLFRGLALWLIYIDHASPDVLTWFTIRNYGFSDAAEIFIFVSGYTAAFVYGRAMLKSGFLIATARILKRVWQIYLAHMFLFTVYFAEIVYLAARFHNPHYTEEMGIESFLERPDLAIVQALLLRFRPLNMDVLPLYIVLMSSLPLVLWLMKWRSDVPLVLSIILYALAKHYDLYLAAYPSGFWAFNPYDWQLLFVFGAWCALGGAKRMAPLLSSRITVCVAVAYLLAAFAVTLTWDFPQLEHVMPGWMERLIYPIDKTDLDLLRFLHFLALAVVAVYFVPGNWPGLKWPWLWPMIQCGQFSLQIFCLGVFLSFAGYFVLTETSAGLGLHILLGSAGILIMCATAWMLSWYKHYAGQTLKADFVG